MRIAALVLAIAALCSLSQCIRRHGVVDAAAPVSVLVARGGEWIDMDEVDLNALGGCSYMDNPYDSMCQMLPPAPADAIGAR